jgi:hypothetical protein
LEAQQIVIMSLAAPKRVAGTRVFPLPISVGRIGVGLLKDGLIVVSHQQTWKVQERVVANIM